MVDQHSKISGGNIEYHFAHQHIKYQLEYQHIKYHLEYQHSEISGGNIESEEEDDRSSTRQPSQPRNNPTTL